LKTDVLALGDVQQVNKAKKENKLHADLARMVTETGSISE
jgi:hypothetical protein